MDQEKPVHGTGKVEDGLIDDVTGATWGERNRIMNNRFKKKLKSNDGSVPQFCPPGQKLTSKKDEASE